MNKALILSIKPEHAIKILNGEKTLELRKSVPKGFVGWVYCYVTKGKPNIYKSILWPLLNGTIPFRFWFDEYKLYNYLDFTIDYLLTERVLNSMCLTEKQVNDYGKGKDLYAWHIKQLDIFDKPMQLSEFYKIDSQYIQDYERLVLDHNNKIIKSESKLKRLSLTKAPQSYMYAWVKEELK